MIVADKRYVDQKAIMIPSPENFCTAVNDGCRSCFYDYRVYFAKQVLSARRCNNG